MTASRNVPEDQDLDKLVGVGGFDSAPVLGSLLAPGALDEDAPHRALQAVLNRLWMAWMASGAEN